LDPTSVLPPASRPAQGLAGVNPRQSDSDALYTAAVVQWRNRRRDEAIKLIDEPLRVKPDFAAALCMGGYMLGECGKPGPALRFYRRALEFDASLTVAHVNVGKLLFGAGRFAEALHSFEAATTLAPDDADAWSSRSGVARAWAARGVARGGSTRAFPAPRFP
jgi:tetratricopeptide (TPR) repeat protein